MGSRGGAADNPHQAPGHPPSGFLTASTLPPGNAGTCPLAFQSLSLAPTTQSQPDTFDGSAAGHRGGLPDPEPDASSLLGAATESLSTAFSYYLLLHLLYPPPRLRHLGSSFNSIPEEIDAGWLAGWLARMRKNLCLFLRESLNVDTAIKVTWLRPAVVLRVIK